MQTESEASAFFFRRLLDRNRIFNLPAALLAKDFFKECGQFRMWIYRFLAIKKPEKSYGFVGAAMVSMVNHRGREA